LRIAFADRIWRWTQRRLPILVWSPEAHPRTTGHFHLPAIRTFRGNFRIAGNTSRTPSSAEVSVSASAILRQRGEITKLNFRIADPPGLIGCVAQALLRV